MVDVEGGNNLLYLPLDKLMDRQDSGSATTQQKASADILKDIRQRGVNKDNQRTRLESLRSRGTR